MKKPSKKKAPEWARWMSSNSGSTWAWTYWENKPTWYDQYGEWFADGRYEECDFEGEELFKEQAEQTLTEIN